MKTLIEEHLEISIGTDVSEFDTSRNIVRQLWRLVTGVDGDMMEIIAERRSRSAIIA